MNNDEAPRTETLAAEGKGEEPARERPGRAGWLSSSPAWLASGALHALFLTALTLFVIERLLEEKTVPVQSFLVAPPRPVPEPAKIDFESHASPLEFSERTDPSADPFFPAPDPAESFETPSEVPVEMPAAGAPLAGTTVSLAAFDGIGMAGGGGPSGAFSLRSTQGRKKAVSMGGGSGASESAVEAALAWLARNQETDGHWDCEKHGGRSGTKRGHRIVKDGYDIAVTGLAVLAFLGAGHDETAGRYADNVRRALYWLEAQQKEDGRFCENNYSHAIATLAFAEHHGMAGGHKETARRAMAHVSAQQNKSHGGWTYNAPTARGDTSVTAWMVMAAKSARLAGLDVDPALFELAAKHFQGAGAGKTSGPVVVFYESNNGKPEADEEGSNAIVGATMASLLYMGRSPSDPWMMKAADRLNKKGAELRNLYSAYYGALALFQVGGEAWEKFNKTLRDPLIEAQVKDGDERGSWDSEKDLYGKGHGGRVYTTALAAMALEVYYRYLPIYQDGAKGAAPPPRAPSHGTDDPTDE